MRPTSSALLFSTIGLFLVACGGSSADVPPTPIDPVRPPGCLTAGGGSCVADAGLPHDGGAPTDAGPPRDGGSPDAGGDGGPDLCAGVVCSAPHAHASCVAGKCVVGACDDGYVECDGNPANGCEPLLPLFADKDGDGHGAVNPNGTVIGCEAQIPPGFVTSSDDCDDADARVFPGQTAFFTTPTASGGFDFDCDGKATKRLTRVDSPSYCLCGINPPSPCVVSQGWRYSLPECGESQDFSSTTLDCKTIDYVTKTQACR